MFSGGHFGQTWKPRDLKSPCPESRVDARAFSTEGQDHTNLCANQSLKSMQIGLKFRKSNYRTDLVPAKITRQHDDKTTPSGKDFVRSLCRDHRFIRSDKLGMGFSLDGLGLLSLRHHPCSWYHGPGVFLGLRRAGGSPQAYGMKYSLLLFGVDTQVHPFM